MTSDKKLIEQSGLTPETIEKITQALSKIPEIQQTKIYGSRAKGNYRPGSDIDLCLFGPNLTTKHILKLDELLDSLLLPYSFDISIYHTLDDPAFIDHIDRIGINFES